MAWQIKRPRDPNIMFAINYEDGRTAYITVKPREVEKGDGVVMAIARERQAKGEVPEGGIVSIKRVVSSPEEANVGQSARLLSHFLTSSR